MPRQTLNVDGIMGGKKCKVRKRRCSSSSSSSLVQTYRLKRAFLVGKRGGSSTPVPIWKMMSSNSPLMERNAVKGSEKSEKNSISARKLGASLWEINGLPSPQVKRDYCLEDKLSKVGVFRETNPVYSPVSERMDPLGNGSLHRRRGSSGLQKLMQGDDHLGAHQHSLVEANPARSPSRPVIGTKNRLKDVYNSLTTSKELCKVMNRIWRVEQQNSTCLSLVSALKSELDHAFSQVHKLIQEQRTNVGDLDYLVKQFEEEKIVWKMKEEEKIHRAVTSIAGEVEIEKKLRRQTERLNKKLGKELSETKAALSNEKRAKEILEQVCDELARGIGEDKAEVEELKRQSAKVREEVEKEREMLQLADVLREERVQMKLLEAKYQFEEKNELVEKLRSDLEAYLKFKTSEEQGEGSPSYEKIKELEKYLRETLPRSYQYEDHKKDENRGENNEVDDDDDDSVDSGFHSIELNVDDIRKSFHWNRANSRNGSKRNSVDKKSKPRRSVSEKTKEGIEWITSRAKKEENIDGLNKRGLFEFETKSWKNDVEDELERYNMIKDLRDHIVSGSRITSSQDSDRENITPKDL